MKRYFLLPLYLLAPCFMLVLQAQDTYMNERLINNSGDVIGTARYVGMGGALGALGADMSVISWNPAGIGLYRKNDIALTFGGTWGQSHIDDVNRGKGTFDQAGFVYNIKTGGETCPYINFAFNYQKKINFNHNFYADNSNPNGLSQLDQVAEMTQLRDYWEDEWPRNLARLAWGYDLFDETIDDAGNTYYRNHFRGQNSYSYYTHHSEGSLQGFDINLSTNIKDRAFLGLTIGVDNMRYRGWSYYGEDYKDETGNLTGTYDLHNDYKITGTGVNIKFGTIIRPIEDKPFRIALAVETPTWYKLKSSTLFQVGMGITDQNKEITSGEPESYLPFTIRSPWKVRTGIGSTVGSSFAWDVDYEFGAYAGTSLGYPKYDEYYDVYFNNTKDRVMNQLTRDNLRHTHTLRAGIEANASKNFSFRLGYNFSTSAYKKNIGFDQYDLYNNNSPAMSYVTSTNYMRMGNTHILTLGAGYHYKSFYVDLAYKLRNQKADFYAFDTSFADSNLDTQFVKDNTSLADRTINPVGVDLTRQTITCTLGFKF